MADAMSTFYRQRRNRAESSKDERKLTLKFFLLESFELNNKECNWRVVSFEPCHQADACLTVQIDDVDLHTIELQEYHAVTGFVRSAYQQQCSYCARDPFGSIELGVSGRCIDGGNGKLEVSSAPLRLLHANLTLPTQGM